MYSSNNSSWSSSIYAQDAADTNWYQYSLSIVGTPKKYTINTQNTTATSLSTYDGYDLASGQYLTLSSDGSTWTNAALGVASTVSPLFPAPSLDSSLSTDANTIFANTGTTLGNPVYMKSDGSKLWKINSGNLIEYTLSNSWNLISATASGKTISNFGASNTTPPAFTFSGNGKYLYKVVAGYVYQHVLSTPWDITTISSNAISVTSSTLQSDTGTNLTGYGRYLKISPDGTKLFYMHNPAAVGTTTNNSGYTYNFGVPWVASTINLTAASNTGRLTVSGTGYVGGIHMNDDGKTLTVLRNDGAASPTANIVMYSLTTPWDGSTKSLVGSAYNLTTSLYNFTDAAQYASMFLVSRADGKKITTAWGALNNFQTFTTETNTQYNFNIASHGLGSAPTYAFRPFPNVCVQVANTSSYIKLAPIEIPMINANATVAFVTSNSSNVILTSSNVLINGTTSIAVTNVIQGANNAIPASRIATANRYLKYYGKNAGLPNGWFYGNIKSYKFSLDGSKLYIVGSNSTLFPSSGITGYAHTYGIAQYSLSVPFDITTMSLSGTFRPKLDVDAYAYVGVDFDPTGIYMTLLCTNSSNQPYLFFKEFTLSTAWDIETATFSGTTVQKSAGQSTSYALYEVKGKFAPNGLSYFITGYYNNGYENRYILSYCTTTVPFRILSGSSSSFTVTVEGNGAWNFLKDGIKAWAPNGMSFVHPGASSRAAEHTYGISTPFLYTGFSGTGDNTMYWSTQTSGTEGVINWPVPGMGANTSTFWGVEYSPDGNFLYGLNSDDKFYQFSTKAANTTQYQITYTAQSGYPNSFSIPDRTIDIPLTPTLYANGTVLLTSANVANNGRVIATRLDSVYEGTSVDSLTINLWKQ